MALEQDSLENYGEYKNSCRELGKKPLSKKDYAEKIRRESASDYFATLMRSEKTAAPRFDAEGRRMTRREKALDTALAEILAPNRVL